MNRRVMLLLPSPLRTVPLLLMGVAFAVFLTASARTHEETKEAKIKSARESHRM